ncbi:probable tRNA (uracil-O(2)-)-methyltransferase [Elephas maximus indicus]|uniref:probable tRNA (uracil-O(2)-)-methyltransferase n=1 Tax=Elephas maximus indicus TaxID=99487 RepID=UPI0021162A7F|nr:probable tRNA (uracil-O(2)-)-methyltransferase [Elephas maximus indicus]
MAEVGRVAVRDPGALLPGGFWAAVAVWLERPQVANKRLYGARLEARRSAALPRSEARGRWPSAVPGPEERGAGPGPSQGPHEGSPSPGPRAVPAQGMAGRGPGEAEGRRQQGEEPRDPGQPSRAGVGEAGFPASELDSLWGDFSRSLVTSNGEMLAFLARSESAPQEDAPRDLDVVLRTIIPKTTPQGQLTAPRREMVVRDVLGGTLTFLPLEEDAEGNLKVKISNVYQIQLSRGRHEWFISVLIFCPERWHSDGIVYPKPIWLGKELLARLAKWSVENKKSEFTSTLSLVSVVKYSKLYQELKEKYKEMVKVWPEVTDPEKFVYEDVAIATYLLILWEEERAEWGVTKKQSFVDLGCGNGLLVHILRRAGHPGRGIDVRRRRIWAMFGPETQLEEGAVTPEDKSLFPDVDWLIGNHSDELTPWIPVIAARSSYHCRFFVLPCCFFDFVGKYPRRQSQKTQYREYLDFIKEVGLTCGFHVEEDCLRIPSTKRVCLVGMSRTYPPDAEISLDEKRTRYIHSRRRPGGPLPKEPSHPPPKGQDWTGPRHGPRAQEAGPEPGPAARGAGAQAEGLWLSGFQPRETVERVRNCSALPRDFIDRVVLQVARLLLGRKQPSTGGDSQDTSVKPWNPGGSLSLAEVASEMDKETLQRLKRECGGLQTLLRNRHQVFSVLNGRVCLRDWREEQLQRKTRPELRRGPGTEAFKTRPCWFFMHHPDGCALPAASCPFAHGPGELQPAQSTRRAQQLLQPVATTPVEA